MIYQYYLEIKNRILLLILMWFFTIFVCYFYKELLLFLCITKINLLNNVFFYFIFTDVKEVFSVYFKLIFFISQQIFIFYFVFHIMAFISLGLYKFEYNYLKRIYFIIIFFYIFLYFFINQILLPVTWNFFLSFQSLTFNLYFEAKLNEYIDFYIYIYCFFIFNCQFFVFLIFFFESNVTNLKLIKKFRKFFHYFFIFFSTCITPPDIFSQILLSFFFVLVYELIIILKFIKIFLKIN